MRLRLSSWLPALALVLCQTLLLVHQADIDAHIHGEHCSICLQAHGLDNAPPASAVLHLSRSVSPLPAMEQQPGRPHQSGGYYLSRAPPPTTHSTS